MVVDENGDDRIQTKYGRVIIEAPGYFHSVRFADVENNFCSKASPSVFPSGPAPHLAFSPPRVF
jgi:hypothetical protein